MPQQHLTAAEFKATQKGSTRAHHDRVGACLHWFALHSIPAVPIATTGIPVPGRRGGFELKANEAQKGISDIACCLPPHGRMGLVEVKTGNARRTPAQRRQQSRFHAAGAVTMVVRDVAELEGLLELRGGSP